MMRRAWHGNCNNSRMRRILPLGLLFSLVAAPVFFAAAVHADAWGDLPDPTRPYRAAASRPVTSDSGMLQTTVVSPTRKVAVINGVAKQIGDRVGDATIVDIRPYEVVLRNARGSTTSLRLLGHRIKAPRPHVQAEISSHQNNKLP